MEPKTCQKGPKVGSQYLLTFKTSHCVHGIPQVTVPPMGGGGHGGGDCKGWGIIRGGRGYHPPPPMSLAQAIILSCERGGATARGAMFLHSRWGGQQHALGYHSKAFQDFTTIALSALTLVSSNPQQYTSTH